MYYSSRHNNISILNNYNASPEISTACGPWLHMVPRNTNYFLMVPLSQGSAGEPLRFVRRFKYTKNPCYYRFPRAARAQYRFKCFLTKQKPLPRLRWLRESFSVVSVMSPECTQFCAFFSSTESSCHVCLHNNVFPAASPPKWSVTLGELSGIKQDSRFPLVILFLLLISVLSGQMWDYYIVVIRTAGIENILFIFLTVLRKS